MVYLFYGEGKNPGSICSRSQVILLADGTCTTADKFLQRQCLLDKEGKPVRLKRVSLCSYEGGMRQIAASRGWARSPHGHLMPADGVVVGDYLLGIRFKDMSTSQKVAGDDCLPRLGTPEYGRLFALLGENTA
jgi:hypothetical protein